MFRFFQKKKAPAPEKTLESRFVFFPVGFHGDQYLLKVVDVIGQRVNFFAETGSNVGSTLSYFAKRFPDVTCVSCEPDKEAFAHAQKNSAGPNVIVYNETSQAFLNRLSRDFKKELSGSSAFWIDAHGYGFAWPLIEEMQFIMKNASDYYILVDDFKVPDIPEFGFDVYEEQVCSHEYIRDHLPKQPYFLYYPTYKEKTSQHHPLRGWGLYTSKRIDWKEHGIDFVREEVYGA